ncbi:hypothetical protein ABK040_012203 [Willaertia magna]
MPRIQEQINRMQLREIHQQQQTNLINDILKTKNVDTICEEIVADKNKLTLEEEEKFDKNFNKRFKSLEEKRMKNFPWDPKKTFIPKTGYNSEQQACFDKYGFCLIKITHALDKTKVLLTTDAIEDKIVEIEGSGFKENTQKFIDYVYRIYMTFWSIRVEIDPQFNGGVSFSIMETTVKFYAFTLAEAGYSFSTILQYSYSALSKIHFLKEKSWLPGSNYKNFYKGIVARYGMKIRKVPPMLNAGRNKILSLLDQSVHADCRLAALVLQGRARGIRGDSWNAAKLCDLLWTLLKDEKNRGILCTRLIVTKDKNALADSRTQQLYGLPKYSICPNIALLLYLSLFHKVFHCNDPVKLLHEGTDWEGWKYNDGLEPIFTQTNSLQKPMTNKDMSNTLFNFCSKHKFEEKYTTRSFHSGLCCTLLMKSLNETKDMPANIKEQIRAFIGWDSIKMVDVYARDIVNHYSSTSAMAEVKGDFYLKKVTNLLMEKEGFDVEDLDDESFWESVSVLSKLKLSDLFCNNNKKKKKNYNINIKLPKELSLYLRLIYNAEDEFIKEQNEAKMKRANGGRYRGRTVGELWNKYAEKSVTELEVINSDNYEYSMNAKLKLQLKKQIYITSKWDPNLLYTLCEEKNLQIITKPGNSALSVIKKVENLENIENISKEDNENTNLIKDVNDVYKNTSIYKEAKQDLKRRILLHKQVTDRRYQALEEGLENIFKRKFGVLIGSNNSEEEKEESDEEDDLFNNDKESFNDFFSCVLKRMKKGWTFNIC